MIKLIRLEYFPVMIRSRIAGNNSLRLFFRSVMLVVAMVILRVGKQPPPVAASTGAVATGMLLGCATDALTARTSEPATLEDRRVGTLHVGGPVP